MNNKTTVNKTDRIPLKPICRLVKQTTTHKVSKQFIEDVRDYIENIVKEIVIDAGKQLEEDNRYRVQAGLREKVRIDRNLFLSLSNKFYKVPGEFKDDDSGNASLNVTTELSKADRMVANYVR